MATLTARAFEGQRRFHVPTNTAPSSVKVNGVVRADYTFASGLVHFNSGLTQGDTVEIVFVYPNTGVDGPGGSGFSGAYADLTGKPALFSGAYGDLSGKPTLGTGAAKDTGTTNGTIPIIGAGDKLPASIIPAVSGGGVSDWTQIGIHSPGGGAGSYAFSNIPSQYNELLLQFRGARLTSTASISLQGSSDNFSTGTGGVGVSNSLTGNTPIYGVVLLANVKAGIVRVDSGITEVAGQPPSGVGVGNTSYRANLVLQNQLKALNIITNGGAQFAAFGEITLFGR